MSLLDDLRKHADDGAYPLHMPGHKRNPSLADGLPFGLDVTELPGFDDLHDMRGVLRGVAELGARLYGAASAFPLVCGTTGGILAAVRAATLGRSGSLVFSRYSHRSVYHAAGLCGLTPAIFTPPRDETSGIVGSAPPAIIAETLERAPDALAVVVTSPTYEGVVSDIAAAAAIAHARGLPLIVDAAHGAHFGFHGAFPANAVRLGADIEVVSLHKTLPAMTQCSLALVSGASRVPPDAVARQLRVFETTSPSYVLLASIDRCLRLLDARGGELFGGYAETLRLVSRRLSSLRRLRRVDFSPRFFGYDAGKLAVSTLGADIDGGALAERLRRDHAFEVETHSDTHLLAMTSVADTRGALLRFADALCGIDGTLSAAAKTVAAIVPPGAGAAE